MTEQSGFCEGCPWIQRCGRDGEYPCHDDKLNRQEAEAKEMYRSDFYFYLEQFEEE